ncbi:MULTISPECIES: flagellar assembly protein FliH [Pseudomonas]|uniref:Flagellar assembly protein FliH n=1 Tax=Pseudomonas segetis TaxID=298908 RepID=A0A239JUD0_9PSED|nr:MULTISPECIES: flagellar assembly protein FliH [Pseudomonas]SNT09536.1 flagellar assembly protein FliH [Pseudomonas segetis]
MAKEVQSELIRAGDINALDVWSLPSFDQHPDTANELAVEAPDEPPADAQLDSEEVAPEDVKPLTLDELEAIRQEAYNEGLLTGERDGYHAGQLKAKQEAEAALASKLEGLERVMSQLFEPIAEQDQQIEAAMVDLVSRITREVIQRELAHDSSHIRQVLREALKLLPIGDDNVRIHLNPQDYDIIKTLRDRHEESWRILEDESLLPGGCRVECANSRIDATVETRITQSLKQLFEQQREQAVHPLEADMHIPLSSAENPTRET